VIRISLHELSVAIAATLVLTGTACGGGASPGTALENRGTFEVGLAAIRTGTEIGINGVWLTNVSHSPITIDSVQQVGRRVGIVVRPVETEIAVSGPRSVPVSAYAENPPVELTTRGCVVQELRPVVGYRLLPGKFVTLWTILLGLRPGHFNVPTHLITYTQDGTRHTESIPEGYHGSVTRDAPLLTTGPEGSGGCWRVRHSHLLKGVPW